MFQGFLTPSDKGFQEYISKGMTLPKFDYGNHCWQLSLSSSTLWMGKLKPIDTGKKLPFLTLLGWKNLQRGQEILLQKPPRAVAEFITLLIYHYPGAHKPNCKKSPAQNNPNALSCNWHVWWNWGSNPCIHKWRAKQTLNFLVHEAERLWSPKQITQVCLSCCLMGWIHTTPCSSCQRYKAGSSHNLVRQKQWQ